ncbi:Crp/Fnr family transcriptional regulator [Mesorhizobium sp. RP14(2022)]|uniref:Crp/Fnr family transcriptional regulator n=1 Tax=Mesorhizobium liriopis TaxID=2953882 RepID=A0ABT1C2S8_9HYPH|nr:Crp/Fnr family transcriptional regulator [Mesorhizobium liriopis]MCO6049142.1 Crp/Fnr family transcriptional regulator [Mesorhizobium liriopis]
MLRGVDAFAIKLEAFGALSLGDQAALNTVQGPVRRISAGTEIVAEGQPLRTAYILREGWTSSSKQLRDGSRQVIDIQIPGDHLGLSGILLSASDRTYTALTKVEVTQLDTERLLDALGTSPNLARLLLKAASREEAMLVEHLVSIGKRDATARTLHFLLELGARMRLVGRGSANRFECPISQATLADALGMTAIHLNRVLRQLREAQLMIFREGIVTFLDVEKLIEMADFDRGYLEDGMGLLG